MTKLVDQSVSVILPTYNESGNIEEVITRITECMPDNYRYEIIIVDDDSPDGTFGIVDSGFRSNTDITAYLRTTDRGLAKSIRYGIERAKNELVLVMDTDLTHDPKEIPAMLHVSDFFDLVSGSRYCAGGDMEDPGHYYLSLCFNWWLRLLLGTQVQDNLGGFFVARREIIMALPLDEIFYGYGDYYFRLIHYIQRSGGHIVEVPATYLERTKGQSKSNWLTILFRYTLASIDLAWRQRTPAHLMKRKSDQ